MEYMTQDGDWIDDLTRRKDIGAVGKRTTRKKLPDVATLGDILEEGLAKRAATKQAKVVDEESQAEIAKLKKELGILQKKFDAQTDILKGIVPQINSLEELTRDAAARMEADTLDDVYDIGNINAEFKKLRTSIDKYIPKEINTIVDKQKYQYERDWEDYKRRNSI